MVFEKDFREFCSLLNEERIDFLIVGGYAVAFHGAPRANGDITNGVISEYLLGQRKILVRSLRQSLGPGGVNAGLNRLYQIDGSRSVRLALRVVL
jgi:hypothetical protein